MKQEELDPQTRRNALLALAMTKPSGDDKACLGDDQLTAFVEHRLTGADREATLRHLNRCPTCYQVWLDTTEALQDKEVTPAQSTFLDSLTARWRHFLGRTRWRPLLAVPATAMALLVGVMLLQFLVPSLMEQIDAQYSAISMQQNTSLAPLVEGLPLPWERAALGFSAKKQSPPDLAFGAGLWAGRATLLDQKPEISLPEFLKPTTTSPWPDSEWATYYQAGRWIVLLWVLAQSSETTVDWPRQLEILKTLETQLAKRATDEVAIHRTTKSLTLLGQYLTSLAHQDDYFLRTRLRRQLEVIMQRLMLSN